MAEVPVDHSTPPIAAPAGGAAHPLGGHPLFADVSATALARLAQHLQSRRYAAGEVILRAGVPSAELFGVVDGAVRVELGGDGGRRVLLVPPQCFGEMSALTGAPVSATVVAERDTRTWVLPAPVLFDALAPESAFFRNVASLLGHRLRDRTRRIQAARPQIVLLPSGADADDTLLVSADTPARLPDTLAAPVVWNRGPVGPAALSQRWCHSLAPAEIAAAAASAAWSRTGWPAVDHLVRRLTGREVGLAMSVGAAAGLAHLGVLEVLEAEGVPIDYLCGSSMGGAVGLAFARYGSARAAAEMILRLVADFARAKGLQWLPRRSLLSAARMTEITEALYGNDTFAQLRLPVALVAADLAQGKRVVLDSGPVAPAARASAAIPGLFAPVRLGDMVLVDGGVVTRVPADLLAARGCGFKLASLVRPSYAPAADAAQAADRLEARLDRPFGLRAAVGGAWRLLGWWDSASQAEHADLSLTIPIPVGEGFNFQAAAAMVDCGRRTAQERLPQIRQAVHNLLAPGVP